MDFIKNGVFVALIGHGLIGLSLVWDKVLLKQPETRNLVSYVFWLGAISIFGFDTGKLFVDRIKIVSVTEDTPQF